MVLCFMVLIAGGGSVSSVCGGEKKIIFLGF